MGDIGDTFNALEWHKAYVRARLGIERPGFRADQINQPPTMETTMPETPTTITQSAAADEPARTLRSRVATIAITQDLVAYDTIMRIDPQEVAERLLAQKLAEVTTAIRHRFLASAAAGAVSGD